jgi:hypothetical protein
MKMSAILIAAIALSATAPAFAAQSGNPDQPRVTYDAKRDRYCISQMITGNYLPVKDCRSKEDWAKAGLTLSRPDEPKTLAAK